jgi:hypothetical protein
MLREFLIKIDVPEWARWYAVDEDGSAYFYENKPFLNRGECDIWFARGRIEYTGIDLGSHLFGDCRETLHEIKASVQDASRHRVVDNTMVGFNVYK